MNKMIQHLLAACVVALVFASVAPAQATEVMDVQQTYGPGGLSHNYSWQQTFVPNANNITAVSVYLQFSSGTCSVEIQDSVCGTVLNHGSGAGTSWVKCDLVGAEALVPGNTYVISVTSTVQLGFGNQNPYPAGSLFIACDPFVADYDLQFITWTDRDAVDNEPTAWGAIKSMYN